MNVGWYGPGNTQRLYSAIYEVESETTWTNPMASAYRAPPYLRTNVWVSEHSNGLRYIRGPYDWITTTGHVNGAFGPHYNTRWAYSHADHGAGGPSIYYTNPRTTVALLGSTMVDRGFFIPARAPDPRVETYPAFLDQNAAVYVGANAFFWPVMQGGQLLQTIGKRSWVQRIENGLYGWATGFHVTAVGSLITNQITTNINGAITQILNQVVYMDAPVLQHDLLPNAIARPEWDDWVGFSDALASSCYYYLDTNEFNPDGTFEGEWINGDGYATNFVHHILPSLTFSSVLARAGMGYNTETVGSINDWSYKTNVAQRQISASNLVEVYAVANYLTHTFMDDNADGLGSRPLSDNIQWVSAIPNSNYVSWRSKEMAWDRVLDAIAEVEATNIPYLVQGSDEPIVENKLHYYYQGAYLKVRAYKTASKVDYTVSGLSTDIAHTVSFYTYFPAPSPPPTNLFGELLWEWDFRFSGQIFDPPHLTNQLVLLDTVGPNYESNAVVTIGYTNKPPDDWPYIPVHSIHRSNTWRRGFVVDEDVRKATVEWDFEFATTPPP